MHLRGRYPMFSLHLTLIQLGVQISGTRRVQAFAAPPWVQTSQSPGRGGTFPSTTERPIDHTDNLTLSLATR